MRSGSPLPHRSAMLAFSCGSPTRVQCPGAAVRCLAPTVSALTGAVAWAAPAVSPPLPPRLRRCLPPSAPCRSLIILSPSGSPNPSPQPTRFLLRLPVLCNLLPIHHASTLPQKHHARTHEEITTRPVFSSLFPPPTTKNRRSFSTSVLYSLFSDGTAVNREETTKPTPASRPGTATRPVGRLFKKPPPLPSPQDAPRR